MKKTISNRKISILVLLICLFTVVCATVMSVSASEEVAEGWTFTENNLDNPFYINEFLTEAPQAYEVELNMPENPSSASVILGNWYSGSTRYFGLSVGADGVLNMLARGPVIKDDGSTDDDETTQVKIPGYSVNGKGWIKIAVVRDTIIDEANGIYKAVYTIYENGVKMVSTTRQQLRERTRDGNTFLRWTLLIRRIKGSSR